MLTTNMQETRKPRFNALSTHRLFAPTPRPRGARGSHAANTPSGYSHTVKGDTVRFGICVPSLSTHYLGDGYRSGIAGPRCDLIDR